MHILCKKALRTAAWRNTEKDAIIKCMRQYHKTPSKASEKLGNDSNVIATSQQTEKYSMSGGTLRN